MRTIFLLGLLAFTLRQEYVLHQERARLALLIQAVEADHADDDIPQPRPIPECTLPKILTPPRWNLGRPKPEEN